MAFRKGPLKPTRGLRESREHLSVEGEGDCPRCRGNATTSSIPGFLKCEKCSYEWQDPDAEISRKHLQRDSISKQSKLVEQVKNELQSGTGLSRVLGIDDKLSSEQHDGLVRLQDKWMEGLHGHYNPASEQRTPLIVRFDEDDNIVDSEVGRLIILDNTFDGGEEIRIEYPGKGTEFYCLNGDDTFGWRAGKTVEETARNIAAIINTSSQFVYANQNENIVTFELQDERLNPAALVLFVDDPGSKDMVAEKQGVTLDAEAVSIESDYQIAVELVLSDGIITPSEDQLLWAMRQHLNISEERHIHIVTALFGDGVTKECSGCGEPAPLYKQHLAWWCDGCQMWL